MILDLLTTNILYTLRVLLVGGILVRVFMHYFTKHKLKYEYSYWISVFLMSQVTFWIDYVLFSRLFGQ